MRDHHIEINISVYLGLSVWVIIGQQEACSEGRQRQQLHQLAPASAGGGAAPA